MIGKITCFFLLYSFAELACSTLNLYQYLLCVLNQIEIESRLHCIVIYNDDCICLVPMLKCKAYP